MGHTLKMIYLDANKAISIKILIESYFTSVETQKEQHDYYKSSLEGLCKGTAKLPQLVTMRLNDQNINTGYEVIAKAYRKQNQDPVNPY